MGYPPPRIPAICLVLALAIPSAVEAATVTLQAFSGSGNDNRWMDIADNLYSSAYQDSFTYARPSVTISYTAAAGVISGTLTATGLKPNFSYQMKLVGDPAMDRWTNEQLGYAGRWWRVQPNPGNSNDTDYDAHKDDPGYLYQGYLLFGYFTSDQLGNASVNFTVNSSYHVLWATSDSTGAGTGHKDPGPNDSAVAYYDFSASPATNPAAYDTDYGSAHVGVFAEWESGRALPGELSLPPGLYNCRFVLTEESFHQSGLGGGWASVLRADVQVSVIPDGDLNLDGSVDVADVLLGIQVLDGVATPGADELKQGDVAPLVGGIPAPDGLFTPGDLLVIQRRVLGLIDL